MPPAVVRFLGLAVYEDWRSDEGRLQALESVFVFSRPCEGCGCPRELMEGGGYAGKVPYELAVVRRQAEE